MERRALDDIDERLVALLVRNARESTTNLAKRVGLSRPAVHERIRRLERAGVLRGYTALVAGDAAPSGIRAQVLVSLEPRHQERILDSLSGLAEVRRLATVSGEYDVVAEVAVRDPGELDRLLTRIGRIPGIIRTVTLVTLTTSVDRDAPARR
jgi:DNA-binding Lrp family transcriptional regulator